MLLSPVAHAKIKNIDVSDALKVEGVRAVAKWHLKYLRKYYSKCKCILARGINC